MTTKRKLNYLMRRLLRPALCVRWSWRAVRAHGAAHVEETGRSPASQFFDQLLLGLRHDVHPILYYMHRLHHDRANAAHYLSSEEIYVIQSYIQPDGQFNRLVTDKRAFAAKCDEHALPTARILATFARGAVASGDVAALPQADLICKPATGIKGRGVVLVRYEGAGQYLCEGDRRFDAAGLIDHLCLLSADGEDVILQQRLYNHPEIARLSQGGLCTVRIVTYREASGRSAHLQCVLRMPFGDSATDNFSGGGLASPIHLATGRLGRAVRDRPRYVMPAITHHPATGHRIEGVQLPFWQESLQLCLDAQTAFGFHSVGWDVAITAEGPLLLEGNFEWGCDLLQQAHGTPIGLTPYADASAAWLRDKARSR